VKYRIMKVRKTLLKKDWLNDDWLMSTDQYFSYI
jgi:hypothetical protein